MARTKITARFDITRDIENFSDDQLKSLIGNTIINESKDFISKGISPVSGIKRFERYKDVKKYPGGKKDNRPVNLELTGKMLKELNWREIDKDVISFGIFPDAPEDVRIRAEVHNNGVPEIGIVARPFIPSNKGETLIVSILRKILDIYEKKMDAIIKKSNK